MESPAHAPLEDFRFQTRDLYVPPGDIGMWQGALRGPDDAVRVAAVAAIEARQPLTVELLYTDQIGRQRTISRFGLVPANDTWLASLNRHWFLDWDGPRPEGLTMSAADLIFREHDAARQRRNGGDATGASTGGDPSGTGGDVGGGDRADNTDAASQPPPL